MSVNLKKGLSFLLVIMFVLTILPATAFAASLEEIFAISTDLGGWYYSKQSNYATLEKVSDGVQVRHLQFPCI